MARVSGRKIVVRQDSGVPMEIGVGTVMDHSEPQADEDTKLVPEFVNISGKVQIMTVPDNPTGTMSVPPFGILRGAQWRMYSKEHRAWGRTAPFMERAVKKDGEKYFYDKKYLLDEGQIIDQVNQITKRKRIWDYINNSTILETNELTRMGLKDIHVGKLHYENNEKIDSRKRGPEDRSTVTATVMKRIQYLEEAEKKAKIAAGVGEAG